MLRVRFPLSGASCLSVILSLCALSAVPAQTIYTKANNADALDQVTSWNTPPAFTALDTMRWDSTVTGANTVNLLTGAGTVNLGQIQVLNPGGPVTVNVGAGNVLNLSGVSGLGMDLTAATQNLTLNLGTINVVGSQSWQMAVGRLLTVSSAVNLGTNTLTLGSATALGNSTLTGLVSGTQTAGSTALSIQGGFHYLTGANTYTGQTVIGAGGIAAAGSGTAFGAAGAGNEVIVQSGGTLNVAGANLGAKRVQIAGTGVDNQGAITNTGAGQTNALQFVTLAADASVSAVGTTVNTGASGNNYGRFDVRASSYVAGAKNLDLAGFTLTKEGGSVFSVINADVSAGNFVVNNGILRFEGTTILAGSAANTITVNNGGRLGLFGLTTGPIHTLILNAGSQFGEDGSNAASTYAGAITIAGQTNFNSLSGGTSNVLTLSGKISSTGGTSFDKRGAGLLSLTNQTNDFALPVNIYQGTLRADYTTALTAGTAPQALTGSPLGTDTSAILLRGGTLALRIAGASDTTNQVAILGRGITVDNAPSTISLDRVSGTGTDKNVLINLANPLTFAASSAANGWSIGQNTLTVTQTNTHRYMIGSMVLNNDTAINNGDVTLTDGSGGTGTTGGVISAMRNSFLHIGTNSWGTIGGTHQFGAVYQLGGNLRVGSMYGTAQTNATATLGTGPVYIGPNANGTFRTPTNIAAGQTVDLLSNATNYAVFQLEQTAQTAPSSAVRVLGSGVYAVGSGGYTGTLDLSRLGNGTLYLGTNYQAGGNATVSGTILPGAGGLLRLGAQGTMTVNAVNALGGVGSTASLVVGSELISGAVRNAGSSAMNGTVVVTNANAFTGGTTVYRSTTLNVQALNALGAGAVDVYGTLIYSGANGRLEVSGANTNVVNLYGGSTLTLDNASLTNATNLDRWNDATPISLIGATLNITNRNHGSITSENVGALSFAGGSTINPNRSNNVTSAEIRLVADSLSRVGTGTLEISRAGNSGFGTTTRFSVTNSAPTPVNGIVSPYYSLLDATQQTTFANYSSTLGFVVPTMTHVLTNTFTTGLTAGTELVQVDFASANTTLTLADNPILYALKVGAGSAGTTINTSGTNNTITLRSGGLIVSGDSTPGRFSTAASTATLNPNFTFNDGTNTIEALINVRNGYTGVMNGTITGSGLTKFGAGVLTLTANNGSTLTGTVSVNQGTLQLLGPTTTGATHSPAGSGGFVMNGGQLNLRAANIAGTSFSTSNNGGYTLLNNGITVASGFPLATVDLNRSALDTTSSGTITINPATVGLGLVLQGAPGLQGQTFTLSGANYGLLIGTNGINTFTGNVTINNAVTLTLNNGVNVTAPNSTITKSGGGSWIVGANAGATSVASNTTVVVNAGTLEMRSLGAFGDGGATGTRLVLNGGTVNFRRDTSGTYGNLASTPYAVTVNGTAAISVDRLGTTATNQLIGLGKLTLNGNAVLSFSNGSNGYGVTFQGAQLNGSGFINSNVTVVSNLASAVQFLSGFDVSGGSLVKLGGGSLTLANANNSYDGGTYIQQGILRVTANNALGKGDIYLNPGAALSLESTGHFDTATQTVYVAGNSSFLPMISVRTNVAHPTTGIDTSAAPVGIIGISNTTNGTYNTVLDMSALYGGYWSLGALSSSGYDGRYTATALGAGAGNVYRLGGGGASFVINQNASGAALSNVLTGNNSVRLGFDSGNVLAGAGGLSFGNFQFVIRGNNNYTGGTVIHRGQNARIETAPTGGFTGLSNTAVDLYGVLQVGNPATLVNAGNTATNAITFHPGSAIILDRSGTNGATVNQWNDTTNINLDGAIFDLLTPNTAATTFAETVGAVTIARGARISLRRAGTGTNGVGPFNNNVLSLTMQELNGLTAGNTLTIQTGGVGTLGLATPGASGTNSGGADRLFITGTAPTVTNGMVDPRIVTITGTSGATALPTFVSYDAANGFIPTTYDSTFTVAGALTAGLAPTAKVDINSTGSVSLSDNPVIYALRTNRDITLGGAFNTLTLRSGGLILHGNTLTVQPNLIFHDGTNPIEARIFNSSTATLNGSISANGVTKFGNGTLNLNQPQPDYNKGWIVNAGVLQVNDPNGLGQSVAGNGVTLNASFTSGGNLITSGNRPFNINVAQTQLTFSRDSGSPELVTFTGGPITVVNEATIRITAANDRNVQIPAVIAQSTGTDASSAITFDVPSNRFRAIVPTLTASSNTILRIYDSGATTDTGRITALVVNSLVGSNVEVLKTGNRTWELSGDNSSTFTGGKITITQGTARVRDNGALGSASTAVIIERNAALEIATSHYTPTQTSFTQLAGSIERWNVQDARGTGTYNLPTGVNLQLNTNLLNTQTIGLTGGSLEGFLYSDHVAQAADRIVGPGVTINLLASSSVGQNILQGQGYELGRQPTVYQPFANTYTGTILRIEGNITGSNFDLTKTGNDTVVLSGTGNSYRNTFVDMGLLRIGVANSLPTTGVLTTRFAGIFDLYGNNQTVAGLGSATAGTNPGGVSLGSSGSVVNSALYDSTLTVQNTTDFTYNGLLDLNVALTKEGSGTQTLGNPANTYRGATTLKAGVLEISALADGGTASSIGSSPADAANLVFNGGTMRYLSTAASSTNRQLTLGDEGGTIENNSVLPAHSVNFTSNSAVTHTGTPDDTRTLTLAGSNTGANTFAPVIGNQGAGAVSVTKAGSGTWTLSGASTYTGTTLVQAGTLKLTGSLSNSAVIDVKSAATFDVSGVSGGFALTSPQTLTGTGTVLGALTNQGTIAPGALTGGATTGTLTLSGDVLLGLGSVVNFELGDASTYDRLVGIEDLTLDGTINVTLVNGYVPVLGQSFDLLDWGGLIESSSFSLPTDLVLEDISGFNLDWDRSAFFTSGTLTIIQLVPEPSRALLTMLGLAGILMRRRRGSKNNESNC